MMNLAYIVRPRPVPNTDICMLQTGERHGVSVFFGIIGHGTAFDDLFSAFIALHHYRCILCILLFFLVGWRIWKRTLGGSVGLIMVSLVSRLPRYAEMKRRTNG
jgi:hypothetical protein